ncbi:MAG TPA: S9 family peptidase [Myxococcales bacterium]|nr:S9 family peptidase [Myxococcales bacterium]
MPTDTRLRLPLAALLLAFACATAPQPAERSTAPAVAAPSAPTPAAAAPAGKSVAEAVLPDTPSGPDAERVAELSKKAASLVEAFVNTEALFTRDAKQVVMVSNRDGLPQLYVADAARPDSPARRLVTSKERVTLDRTTPDGKSVLFRTDHGADEKWSVWRVNLDGSGLTELTPGEPTQRDPAFVADLAPDTIYYSARRIADASSAVYAASTAAPGPAKEVFREPKPGFLTDVSRDGKSGLFVRYPTRSENYLLRLDLASGAARPLFPGSGKVSIFDARFSPDGRTIYVATDGGGEQALLLALDAGSGNEKARYVEKDPPISTVSQIAVAKTGDSLALLIDAGNRTELRLLDARTLRPRARVAMPLGQGDLSGFSEDGRQFLARWSTPSSPTDVWSIDSRSGRATQLRKEARPSLRDVPQMETSITEVQSHDGLSLPINVYLPRNRSGRLPVIVAYHGGPSASSRIRWSAATAFFLSQGYAWVEPNVRGSGGFGRAYEEADNGHKRLEAFKDIEATGRWAASQPWADPKRVIVYGGSYGGYTVLVGLTRMPDLWRAGVDLVGVANLKTFMATTSGLIREIFLLEFGDPEKDSAFLDSISPLKDVDRIVAPLFVYAGANDPRVPRSESDLIVGALRARKVPVEYMVAQDEGHSLARKETLVQFLARAGRFLEQHAGDATAPRTVSTR